MIGDASSHQPSDGLTGLRVALAFEIEREDRRDPRDPLRAQLDDRRADQPLHDLGLAGGLATEQPVRQIQQPRLRTIPGDGDHERTEVVERAFQRADHRVHDSHGLLGQPADRG